jgi:hypothetical protein
MYKSIRIMLISLVLVFCFSLTKVNAQSTDTGPAFKCFPTESILSHLEEQGLNNISVAGLDEAGNLMRLFSNSSGQWQIVVTLVNSKFTCPITFGQYLIINKEKGKLH